MLFNFYQTWHFALHCLKHESIAYVKKCAMNNEKWWWHSLMHKFSPTHVSLPLISSLHCLLCNFMRIWSQHYTTMNEWMIMPYRAHKIDEIENICKALEHTHFDRKFQLVFNIHQKKNINVKLSMKILINGILCE